MRTGCFVYSLFLGYILFAVQSATYYGKKYVLYEISRQNLWQRPLAEQEDLNQYILAQFIAKVKVETLTQSHITKQLFTSISVDIRS